MKGSELEQLIKIVDTIEDGLNYILGKNPPEDWIKEMETPEGGYKYLPIDKVEHLLRLLYSRYKIEITNQSSGVNGVWVTVRIHYLIKDETDWLFHDGTAGISLKQYPISAAFQIAKSFAIKDACDHLGRVFGADLNRKDTIQSEATEKQISKEEERLIQMIEDCKTIEELMDLYKHVDQMKSQEVYEAYTIKSQTF